MTSLSAPTLSAPPDVRQKSGAPEPLSSLVAMAIVFGVVTGLVEGVGLLVFQRINWRDWGPMIHVSEQIIWIAPVVDTAFFLVLGALVWLLARSNRFISARQIALFLFSFLALYDWLTLTGRLFRFACVLMALGIATAVARRFTPRKCNGGLFPRRLVVALLGIYALTFAGIEATRWWREESAAAALPPAARGAPNVLVVVIDTLRADHVSSYGYARPTTPTIDALAKQGALFENAVAASSWSLPSHASLVTGRYLYDHKVGGVQREPWLGWGRSGLGGFPTLGEALERQGYRTGAFSANRTYFSHDLGFGRGFIHFEDYFNSAADCFVRTVYGREFSRMYLKRSNHSLVKRMLRTLGWTSLLDQDAEGSGSYGGAFGIRKHADEVNRELLDWIGSRPKRPFFAFLNYFDVHDPYGGPSTYPKPAWPQDSPDDRYDDGVKYVDDSLGRLIQALRQKGLSGNTLVIIVSDHGESLGHHFLITHGRSLYWGLIHVPLIVWYPGHVPAQTVITQPVSTTAIPATIMDLLGAGRGSFSGPSLAAFWSGREQVESQSPIAELVENKYPGKRDAAADQKIPTASTGWMRSIVTPNWHLIQHQSRGDQLYDWIHDPGETNNLIGTPEGQATAGKLVKKLEKETRY